MQDVLPFRNKRYYYQRLNSCGNCAIEACVFRCGDVYNCRLKKKHLGEEKNDSLP